MANLKVTLVKSTIGAIPKHKKTVEALGRSWSQEDRQNSCTAGQCSYQRYGTAG